MLAEASYTIMFTQGDRQWPERVTLVGEVSDECGLEWMEVYTHGDQFPVDPLSINDEDWDEMEQVLMETTQ
jgi:hypothetical protein